MTKLTGQQLSDAVAEKVMGWRKQELKTAPLALPSKEFLWIDKDGTGIWLSIEWGPHLDWNQTMEVEEKIGSLQPKWKYAKALSDIIWKAMNYDTKTRSWWLIHATQEQRLQAALMVV